MKNKILFTILFFSIKAYSQITPEWVAFYDSASAINYYQWQMKVTPAGNAYRIFRK